jgi:hypothetical protein
MQKKVLCGDEINSGHCVFFSANVRRTCLHRQAVFLQLEIERLSVDPEHLARL